MGLRMSGTVSGETGQAAWAEQTLRERLGVLASNLWWTWHPEVAALFRELDPIRWRQLAHNPIALLAEIPVDRLEQRVNELALRSQINGAYRRLNEYLNSEKTWGATHGGVLRVRPVAYFSAEFGLHESLPIYSGGLGLLAGDHVKSASDLDVPLVGVGLFYAQGYFRQRLDRDGWQREESLAVDMAQLPLTPALGPDGKPIAIAIETRAGSITAQIWVLRVGRSTLLLLDSDMAGNQPEDRQLTAHLYGGDNRVRIHQELLLGVGGVRALARARHLAKRLPPQRGPQRLCAAGSRAGTHGRRRTQLRGGAAGSRQQYRIHDPYARAGRPRSILRRPDRGTPRSVA